MWPVPSGNFKGVGYTRILLLALTFCEVSYFHPKEGLAGFPQEGYITLIL
jgi:hypothetical protein